MWQDVVEKAQQMLADRHTGRYVCWGFISKILQVLALVLSKSLSVGCSWIQISCQLFGPKLEQTPPSCCDLKPKLPRLMWPHLVKEAPRQQGHHQVTPLKKVSSLKKKTSSSILQKKAEVAQKSSRTTPKFLSQSVVVLSTSSHSRGLQPQLCRPW